MGNFNAKLDRRKADEEKIGYFGHGKRNERRQMLMNFLEQQKLYAMNTFYKKKPNRNWTWISSNKEHENVLLINYVGLGNDHQIVWTELAIIKKWEKPKIMKNILLVIDTKLLKERNSKYIKELKENLNQTSDIAEMPIDELNTTINKAMLESAEKVVKTRKKDRNNGVSKLRTCLKNDDY
ncbi:hypothetical protein ILUMI_24719 [Ignelater luminosus]|uniref:Uncharacterized protein n=1 Tax=Ignelater luminosus TaxID=2038154 RepID=A0A8K0CBB1_IGNLU|nr:hypothetical protein ILUMI_24719 [Ignelater luminosus]